MKHRASLAVVSLMLGGCYTTKVYTPAASSGIEISQRQWFTLAGLVELSSPAGQECPAGLARAESSLQVPDVLIDVGLSVVGSIAGSIACKDRNEIGRLQCSFSGGGLVPLLLAARSVRYVCSSPTATAPGTWPGAPAQPVPPAPYPSLAPGAPPSPPPQPPR